MDDGWVAIKGLNREGAPVLDSFSVFFPCRVLGECQDGVYGYCGGVLEWKL